MNGLSDDEYNACVLAAREYIGQDGNPSEAVAFAMGAAWMRERLDAEQRIVTDGEAMVSVAVSKDGKLLLHSTFDDAEKMLTGAGAFVRYALGARDHVMRGLWPTLAPPVEVKRNPTMGGE
jgi:hypothetical protein